MNIEQLIQEASWRIRTWLASPGINHERVGWRHDDACCPLSEWIAFEIEQATGSFPSETISVDAEEVVVGQRIVPLPPVLSLFVDLIDGAVLAPDPWLAQDARVSRQEAEAALAEAERRTYLLLLPKHAASVPRCAYIDAQGRRCERPAATPTVHGFFQHSRWSPHEQEQLCRQNCTPFFGGVCGQHWLQVVVPPASWWPREVGVETEREAALLG
jgi:hypothetical protein